MFSSRAPRPRHIPTEYPIEPRDRSAGTRDVGLTYADVFGIETRHSPARPYLCGVLPQAKRMRICTAAVVAALAVGDA